ncbi:hypothetical protein EOT10_35375 [Streptomyces antnestii]|uniref:WXG100 family type VII secretion target n=1 Tax=Streptomyces antnestii TaxID=2494256 RepID=A0A3S2VTH4_9ACTN|nr:hypothetical protein [Streptomyces sp. San01]RVU17031.1 hypothetical protein EOT10_35375 [Streptomyces sp. San01]
MTSPEGYHVAHKGMSDQAGELDGSGDDVGKIGKAVAATMCYSEDVLGGSDTAPAFNLFAAAWEAETKVLEAALHELADKVRLSSHAYRGKDLDVRKGVHGVHGVHGVPVGPQPDAGVSTQPAHAARPSALADY